MLIRVWQPLTISLAISRSVPDGVDRCLYSPGRPPARQHGSDCCHPAPPCDGTAGRTRMRGTGISAIIRLISPARHGTAWTCSPRSRPGCRARGGVTFPVWEVSKPWAPPLPTATCSSACSRSQNGLIDQGQLVAAFQAWTRDKARPLADHLVGRGDLDADQRAVVEALVGAAPQEARRRRREEPGRHPGRPLDPREPGRSSATRTSTPPSPTSAPARPTDRRRRRPHRQLLRRHGHLRRPAVPRPPAPRPGRPGRRLRGPRRRAAPRGGAQADPRPTTPTTRPAARGSCSRPRSPAGWSTPASSRSTAWAPTPTAGPYYAMRFIRGDSLKEAIDRVPRRRGAEDATPAGGRWSCASCCAGSSTSATRSTTPTAAACCTATSSRATSSSASTARRWSSTGAWPSRWAGPSRGRVADERTLVPVVGQRQCRDAARAARWARRPT